MDNKNHSKPVKHNCLFQY